MAPKAILYRGSRYVEAARFVKTPKGQWSPVRSMPNQAPNCTMETDYGSFTKYHRSDGSRYVKFTPGRLDDTDEIFGTYATEPVGTFTGQDADEKANQAVEKAISTLKKKFGKKNT